MSPPNRAQILQFQALVRRFFARRGRKFPWRETRDRYAILVSEVMLQQTQTQRVEIYYKRFLRRFPTLSSLARAPLREVLILWQGLGYNRRAKFLHQLAQVVVKDHGGKLPDTLEALQALPGIGPYTAAAVMTFAFNAAVPMIETNIRTIYLHHFFPRRTRVSDKEILALVEATLWRRNPRKWFYALMDYGVSLKGSTQAVHHRSAHYRPQTRFQGSRRQVRGAIIKQLLESGPLTIGQLSRHVENKGYDVANIIDSLVEERLIQKTKRGRISIA